MPQEYKDYVFANGGIEGQVTPTVYNTAGALTTVSSPAYLGTTFTSALATAAGPFYEANYSMDTRDNSFPNQYLSNYVWQTTVASSYSAPGSRTAV
jgi:hypothetical protein